MDLTNLQEDLKLFFNSEFKGVVQEVVRSELQHELRQYFASWDTGPKFVKINPPDADNDEQSIQSADPKKEVSFDSREGYTRLSDTDLEAEDSGGALNRQVTPPGSKHFPRARTSLKRRTMKTGEMKALIKTRPSTAVESSSGFHWMCDHLPLVSGICVLLNSICIGLSTNYRILHDGEVPGFTEVSERAFCVFFTIEILIRMRVGFYEFFFGYERAWNIFESIVVSLQLLEQTMLLAYGIPDDIDTLPFLRSLRIIRVVRLVRVFHHFEELNLIVTSISRTLMVLFSFIVLLSLVIYFFSILMLQIILDDGKRHFDLQAVHHWFGSVPRTVFTLFEAISGGVSWDEVVSFLMADTTPYAGLVFCLYIFLASLAVLNMLTGLFVDRSMKLVREDRDIRMAAKISHLILPKGNLQDGIDWPTFQEVVKSETMLDYLDDLGIKPSEAEGLFDLLDDDRDGSVNSTELVEGCLRLRGTARALDLALVAREVRLIYTLLEKLPHTMRSRKSFLL